jgi:hypothetical protein
MSPVNVCKEFNILKYSSQSTISSLIKSIATNKESLAWIADSQLDIHTTSTTLRNHVVRIKLIRRGHIKTMFVSVNLRKES